MAKKVGQVRYFNNGAKQNQPSGLSHQDLRTGVPFKNKTIVQLGIQGLPGMQIQIGQASDSPVVIGSTGVYELNVEGLTSIDFINIPTNSLRMIESNPNAYIIIDYIYEEAE